MIYKEVQSFSCGNTVPSGEVIHGDGTIYRIHLYKRSDGKWWGFIGPKLSSGGRWVLYPHYVKG